MSRFRNIFKGPHRSFIIFALVVLAVFLYAWTFGGGNTFISWIRAKSEIVSMDRQIREYREKTREMDSRIRELRSDRDSLEKFAREKFYFAAPGEDIYLESK